MYISHLKSQLILSVTWPTFGGMGGGFVVVIPPPFPSPPHRSDREFTGVSWWSATRERQWEYWWGRGYKMPHDSIQILLVVKPSQKDREFGNCRDNHCSKRRSICTVCSWKFGPPVIQCFNKQHAVDKTIKYKKCFSWRDMIREIVGFLLPFLKSDTSCGKSRTSNSIVLCFAQKARRRKDYIKNIPPKEVIREKLLIFCLSKIMHMVFKVFIRQARKL